MLLMITFRHGLFSIRFPHFPAFIPRNTDQQSITCGGYFFLPTGRRICFLGLDMPLSWSFRGAPTPIHSKTPLS